MKVSCLLSTLISSRTEKNKIEKEQKSQERRTEMINEKNIAQVRLRVGFATLHQNSSDRRF